MMTRHDKCSDQGMEMGINGDQWGSMGMMMLERDQGYNYNVSHFSGGDPTLRLSKAGPELVGVSGPISTKFNK